MVVTAQSLLEGSAYALEQCGLLLNDAAVLFEARSYASAVTLAAFAREELGKSKILFELYLAVTEKGDAVTEGDVERKCGDHVARQAKGQLSVVQRANASSEAGKLMSSLITERPGTEAYDKVREKIEQIEKSIGKREPQNRHKVRLEALYVDLCDGHWNRPTKKIAKDFAYCFLADATNDYSAFLGGDPESKRNQAFERWAECPKFATPPFAVLA